ncbi:SPOR domain-containing protein [Metabacillus sp. RGM 3146]|uniref:SPOR domain-containing protein n=1 Tax=Metabacillus sp. RGM 3146 TaxID=3401092 RepID=UPI003B9D6EAB
MNKRTNQAMKILLNGKEELGKETDKLASLTDKLAKKKEKLQISTWEEKAKTESEVAAAEEKAEKEDEFPWLLPDENEVFQDDPKVVTASKAPKKSFVTSFKQVGETKNRQRFPMKQLLITVTIAVVMGLGFGTAALKFMSNGGEQANGEPAPQTADAGTSLPVSGTVKEGAGNNASADPQAAAGSFSTYVVQAGKFSTKEGADAVKQDLAGKGYPAVSVQDQNAYYVYAGAAADKAQAQAMSKEFQSKSIDAWGGKQTTWNLPSELKSYSKQILALSALSADAAAGNTLDKSELANTAKAISQMPAKDAKAAAFKKELQSAAETLAANSDQNGGWKSQQSLLNAFSGN